MRFCDECDKLAEYYCRDIIEDAKLIGDHLTIVVDTYSCAEHKCKFCKQIEAGSNGLF